MTDIDARAAMSLYDDWDIEVGHEGIGGFCEGQAEATIAVLRRAGFALIDAAASLDAAWAAAEAALPEGWEVSGLDRWGEGWTVTYGPIIPVDPDPGSAAFADTPAAALRALAAKLAATTTADTAPTPEHDAGELG